MTIIISTFRPSFTVMAQNRNGRQNLTQIIDVEISENKSIVIDGRRRRGTSINVTLVQAFRRKRSPRWHIAKDLAAWSNMIWHHLSMFSLGIVAEQGVAFVVIISCRLDDGFRSIHQCCKAITDHSDRGRQIVRLSDQHESKSSVRFTSS